MIILKGGRGCGKTYQLIQMSVQNHIPILVANNMQREHILNMAKEMGYENEIIDPIILHNYLNSHGIMRSKIYNKGIYIDNVDHVLDKLFEGVKINAITYRIEEPKEEHKHNVIMKIFNFIHKLFHKNK